MRSSPTFQPALDSSHTISQRKACDHGITFAAHYHADDYAVSLASGAACLELWTNLPVSQTTAAASSSQSTVWKAVPLLALKPFVGDDTSYVFATTVNCVQGASTKNFSFTYRIVHPDGMIDWLGSPSNDGQIHLAPLHQPRYGFRELVQPRLNTDLKLSEENESSRDADNSVILASLAVSRNHNQGSVAFSINTDNVESGIVVERTKSTWCTSRRFGSLSKISSDFGSNLIILELSRSASNEVLIILPVFDDAIRPARLVRSSCVGNHVHFEILGDGASQAKVALALGTAADLKQAIAICRSYAATLIRTYVHEPLGLSWSAKHLLDASSSLSLDLVLPSLPYANEELDPTNSSFFSDSTLVDSIQTSLSSASSMCLPSIQEASMKSEEQADASTVNRDRTVQIGIQQQPSRVENGLGFCTWEAMQNAERRPYLSEVIAALEAAEKRLGKGSIVALLIDDGWQDVTRGLDDRGRLNSFDMDPAMLDLEENEEACADARSTGVLARYTSYIRRRFPGISSIGCWMTLAGHWDGIHPDGSIAAGLSAPLRHARCEDPFRRVSRDWFIPATELDLHLFWDRAFYSLRESGVDFVKIDAQAEWEWIADKPDSVGFGRSAPSLTATALGQAAFEAMEGAATRYFGTPGGVIHSMGFTSNLTNTLRTLRTKGMVIRSTDDFFPTIPDAHRHHLAHHFYNSLLLPGHTCDADMLSHCSDSGAISEDIANDLDYTGYHASFRAFTDARLWISDKAHAPQHTALSALVSPTALSNDGTRIPVQATGNLLADCVFGDLIGNGVGPALKLFVRHESTSSATIGVWNLRANHAESFDVLDLTQLFSMQADNGLVSSQLYTYYAVRSFRSGKVCLLTSDKCQEAEVSHSLPVTLASGSWDVLSISPLLTTMVQGVSIAFLGATEHFMAPKAVHAVTIAALDPDKDRKRQGRRRSYQSQSPRSSHQQNRWSRSISTDRSLASMDIDVASKDESSLVESAVDTLMHRSDGGARVLVVSLALINGVFATLHTMIMGMIQTCGQSKRSVGESRNPRAKLVDAMIGMLDKLQTLFVFALLVLASWTSILAHARAESAKKTSWLPFLETTRKEQNNERLDGKALQTVRLQPIDAMATLKRCVISRTMAPLRDCHVSLTKSPLVSPKPSLQPLPETPRSATIRTTAKPDVVVTALVDIAAKISLLVVCSSPDSIKTCKIDRTRYDCASTPWILIEQVHLEHCLGHVGKSAFCVQVDMKAWKGDQDETFLQTLSAPVSVSLFVSAPI